MSSPLTVVSAEGVKVPFKRVRSRSPVVLLVDGHVAPCARTYS
jgi:hypothetical protein